MKINKIIKMKDNKYKIFFEDNSLITYDNVILKNNLLYKKNIDKILYDKIIKETVYYDSYNKVVKFILRKKRSKKEVIEFLKNLNIEKNIIDETIDKLQELNLINDLDFCKSYINDKIYLGKDGINKIRLDLIKYGIPIQVIDNELCNVDELTLHKKLETLILKKIKSNKKYSNNYLKQKILNDMLILGYNKDDIIKIIENNIKQDDDIICSEFKKLYYKLNKKFSGIELENMIRKKMLMKGFELSQINSLIKETED